MSDEPISPTSTAPGQDDTAPWAQGTTASSPTLPTGQAAALHGQEPGQATLPPATGDSSFFDPNSVPPELLPAYKQMQAAFTTKTTDLARMRKENEQKVHAYDQFMRDPIGQIQTLAAQYGLQITRAQAAQMHQQAQDEWQPNTWEEVMARAEQRAEERIMARLGPYLGQVHQMQASNVEQQLNRIDPNWKQYEGTMRERLDQHPTLVNDVGLLYRMSVPPEVLEAKAIQQALNRFEGKAKHVGVTQAGTGPRSKPAPPQIKTFEDAVNAARQQLLSGEK